MGDVFSRLADVQGRLRSGSEGFRTAVGWSDWHGAMVLRVYVDNPGGPFALLDAVGAVFGEADVMDGCESCGFGSVVAVRIAEVG